MKLFPSTQYFSVLLFKPNMVCYTAIPLNNNSIYTFTHTPSLTKHDVSTCVRYKKTKLICLDTFECNTGYIINMTVNKIIYSENYIVRAEFVFYLL